MKTFYVFVAALAFVFNASAADVLTEKLQRGLFEEEANHNLDAAIKEYQSVVSQADEQRKVMATALFRLGECYRKLGRTNEANVQYERVMRDFSEQEQLVKLAESFIASAATAREPEYVAQLRRRIGSVRVDLLRAREEADRLGRMTREELARTDAAGTDAVLPDLEKQLIAVEQKRSALAGRGLATGHPEVTETTELRDQILKQRDARLSGLPLKARDRAASLALQLTALEADLKAAEASGLRTSIGNLPMNSTSEKLLREEIALAEQQVRSAEDLSSKGLGPQGEALRAKQDVLRLKRMLPENNSPAQQKALLGEQVAIAQKLLADVQRLAADRLAPLGEDVRLKRELLALQRELSVVSDVATSFGTTPTGASMTQAEAEQLASARALAQNSPDLLHRGMLQTAAQQGFVHVVRFLLEQGVSPDGGGEPPLYLAARHGHKGVVELLLEKGAKPDAVAAPYIGTTALMAAAENGYASVVEALIKGGADVNFTADVSFSSAPGPTALHRAVQSGHRRIIELLISKGAKLNILGGTCSGCFSWWSEGVSPLHIAAGDRAELIELLLKAGADAKLTNFANKQPLSIAVSGRHSDAAVELLLKNGSDPNLYGTNGLNPLFIAMLNHRSNAVALLLQHGADPNARVREPANDWGTPAIMRATTVGVLRQLIQAGADVNATNRLGYPAVVQFAGNAEWAAALLEKGANPNVVFSEQNTPLHHAVHSLRPEAVEALLKHGANPNVLDAKENSPLSIAENYANGKSTRGGTTEADRMRDREKAKVIVALLKQHGANDFLRRAQSISWSRPGKRAETVFSRGTNAWNRYRLYEALALVASGAPFPDFSRVAVNRLHGNTTTNLIFNLEEAFERKSCDKDVWLEWGDIVDIPEMDHRLNEQWAGLGEQRATTLRDCVKRTITIRTPEQTNEIQLVPVVQASRGGLSLGREVFLSETVQFAQTGPPPVPKTSYLFRLKEVVFAANVLRASSDTTRVRVTRKSSETGQPQQQIWNLNDIQMAVSPMHDLWLREGDVIEIPEKQ